MEIFNCLACDGDGIYKVFRNECCGNYNENGSCCGWEEEIECYENCRACNGTGTNLTYQNLRIFMKKILLKRRLK